MIKQTALIQAVNGPLETDGSERFAVANFESGLPNEGKWQYSNHLFDNNGGHTGQYAYKGDLSLQELNIARLGYYSVWVEVWAKSGGNTPIVERRSIANTGGWSSVTPIVAGSENGWTLYRFLNIGITPCRELSIKANGNSIDDVKIYPHKSGAATGEAYRFTTYAYNGNGQLSFINDPNNQKLFYEYDSKGRLSLVRDNDGHIIKKYCYRYNGQPEDCGLFHNIALSQAFVRNNCLPGHTGGAVAFTVPAGMFSSAIGQADADAKAQAYLQANGQAHANANGTCTNNAPCPNCTAIHQKCINGVCETGIQVFTHCAFNPVFGQYEYTYHYEFSDGSWSASVTGYSSAAICFTLDL
jgi:YD repeat-containing protein